MWNMNLFFYKIGLCATHLLSNSTAHIKADITVLDFCDSNTNNIPMLALPQTSNNGWALVWTEFVGDRIIESTFTSLGPLKQSVQSNRGLTSIHVMGSLAKTFGHWCTTILPGLLLCSVTNLHTSTVGGALHHSIAAASSFPGYFYTAVQQTPVSRLFPTSDHSDS